MPATLSIKSATLWRGDKCLFTDLTVDLPPATYAVVQGPNGAGKSSMLRMTAGFITPTNGTIEVNGEPVRRLIRESRAPIHYHGHLDGLKKDLSVVENLRFFSRLCGSSENLDDVLAALDMSPNRERPVRYLSAGQRKRAALALLKVQPAPIWLLDEPFTNLDTAGRAVLLQWLHDHLAAEGSAMIATHEPLKLDGFRHLSIEF